MKRELKDVRYVPQLQKNLILFGALEVQGLRGTLGESVLKMSSDSLVVLKDIRRNNLYYLKDSSVTKNLAALEHLKDDSTRLWHIRFGQAGLNFLEAFVKTGLLESASTCKMKIGEHVVLDKKTKVKFGISTHCSKSLLNCVHVNIWSPIRLHHLEVISTLSLLLITYLGVVGCTPCDKDLKS